MRNVEQRISLVTLGVNDLARARTFYEALGWRGAQQPDDEVCFFQAGGLVFGLWTALGGHGAPGVELAYNVRSADEVDATLEAAERAGADPDGYVWEVAHNPGWTLSDDGSVRL
jgi:catechol 2,3-dioxygenase-like lactoylglutathione lyase family enzyme